MDVEVPQRKYPNWWTFTCNHLSLKSNHTSGTVEWSPDKHPGEVPTNSILATIDVQSLYLKIPHKEGIEAVKNRLYYRNRESDTVPIPPGAMSDLLSIVLTQNYFQFNDSMYHQVQGTAMGTKMAPSYANLFMA